MSEGYLEVAELLARSRQEAKKYSSDNEVHYRAVLKELKAEITEALGRAHDPPIATEDH